MSLLTRITNIFSAKQSNQSIGIALQKNALTLCSIPVSLDKHDNEKAVFNSSALVAESYEQTIASLQDELSLSGKVHLIINEQQSQVVQIDKPSVPEAELHGALKWQVKDLVTIAPENMVLDYYDAPIMAGKEKLNVVCAPLKELKQLVQSITEAGLALESIITQEFAFKSLLPVQPDACLLVCQQPNEEIVLMIVKQGQIYFYRRLRGFAQIANKTEEELSFSVIDALSLEIQRSTDYFERQLKQAPIKEIKVLLPIALEGFVARKLSENTNVPVTLLDLPQPYHEQREYGAVIGASMAAIHAASELSHVQEAANVS